MSTSPQHRPLLLAALGLVLAAIAAWALLDGDSGPAPGLQGSERTAEAELERQRAAARLAEEQADEAQAAAVASDIVRTEIDEAQALGRADGTWLTALLVDTAGVPLADHAVRVTLLAERGPGSAASTILLSAFLQADRAGRIRTNIEGSLRFNASILRDAKRLTLNLSETSRGAPLRGTFELTLPDFLTAGEDCGKVTMTPPPRIVAGVVLGHDGAPVEGALVRLVHPAPAAGLDDLPTTFPTRRVGRDGRFSFHGELPPGSLQLEATLDERVVIRGAEFEPGAGDHVIELVPLGTLLVHLLQAPGALNPVLVHLQRQTAGPQPRLPSDAMTGYQVSAAEGWGQALEPVTLFRDLFPGTYTAYLRRESDAEPLLVVRDVEVAPSIITEDPRLFELDLTPLLERVVLDVRGADGTEPAGVSVRVHRGARTFPITMDEGGGLLLAKLPAKLRVDSETHCPAEVVVDGDRTVTLVPGRDVVVAFPEGLPDSIHEQLVWVARASVRGADDLVQERWSPTTWTYDGHGLPTPTDGLPTSSRFEAGFGEFWSNPNATPVFTFRVPAGAQLDLELSALVQGSEPFEPLARYQLQQPGTGEHIVLPISAADIERFDGVLTDWLALLQLGGH
ncbi:MAG: carboxypeptidase-like regulatory domain-containing protein [Planctomycetota bacterium]|nr:carboxypeptidase-like regulatory domain-containing protein [Planctomycetota bacterium]